MSKTILVKSSMKGIVNVDILKMALEVIAEDEGIEVGDSTEEYFGTRRTSLQGFRIIGSLTTSELPRGIGAAVNKEGKLKYVGDKYGCEDAFKKMQDRIDLKYTAVTLILGAQEEGYEVSTEKVGKDSVKINGVEGGG